MACLLMDRVCLSTAGRRFVALSRGSHYDLTEPCKTQHSTGQPRPAYIGRSGTAAGNNQSHLAVIIGSVARTLLVLSAGADCFCLLVSSLARTALSTSPDGALLPV